MTKPSNNDYNAVWNLFITNGDQEALGMIYFSHYDYLYSFGLRYTNDKQIIEDAIHDIFSYFLKTGGRLAQVNNLRAFLLQSFRHQLLLVLKRKNRFNTNQLNEIYDESHEPEVDDVFEKEWNNRMVKTIARCIKLLSEKQKEAIFLRFQSNLSYNEISQVLGITVDSCYKLIYRSLKELRLEIDRFEEGGKQLVKILTGKS